MKYPKENPDIGESYMEYEPVRSNLILIKFIIGVYMANPCYIRQKWQFFGKIGPLRPYLDYKDPIEVYSIGPRKY